MGRADAPSPRLSRKEGGEGQTSVGEGPTEERMRWAIYKRAPGAKYGPSPGAPLHPLPMGRGNTLAKLIPGWQKTVIHHQLDCPGRGFRDCFIGQSRFAHSF